MKSSRSFRSRGTDMSSVVFEKCLFREESSSQILTKSAEYDLLRITESVISVNSASMSVEPESV